MQNALLEDTKILRHEYLHTGKRRMPGRCGVAHPYRVGQAHSSHNNIPVYGPPMPCDTSSVKPRLWGGQALLWSFLHGCPCSFLDDWQHTSAPYLSTIHPKLVKPLLHHQAAPSGTAKENNSGLSKFFATTLCCALHNFRVPPDSLAADNLIGINSNGAVLCACAPDALRTLAVCCHHISFRKT